MKLANDRALPHQLRASCVSATFAQAQQPNEDILVKTTRYETLEAFMDIIGAYKPTEELEPIYHIDLSCIFIREKGFPAFICCVITTNKLNFFWLDFMVNVLFSPRNMDEDADLVFLWRAY